MVYEVIIKPCPISYYNVRYVQIAGTYQLVIDKGQALLNGQRTLVDFDTGGDLSMVCIDGYFVRWSAYGYKYPQHDNADFEHVREECVEVWREYDGYRRRIV